MIKLSDLDEVDYLQPDPLVDHPNYQYWLTRVNKLHNQHLGRFDRRDYQNAFAALYCLRGRNLCALPMGSGKTLIAALVIAAIYGTEYSKPAGIHIIAPSNLSIKARWLVDLAYLFPEQVEFINSERQLLSCTKPIIIYTMHFLTRKSKTRKETSRPYISRLLGNQYRPNFVVVDEIHNYSANTQRYKHLTYIANRTKRFLGLSGTITDGRLDLMHDVLKLVYDQLWPYTTSQSFKSRFSVKKLINTNYIKGSNEEIPDADEATSRYVTTLNMSRAPEFYELTSRFVHRVSINDPYILNSIRLPKIVEHRIDIQPASAHVAVYDKAIAEYRTALSNVQANTNQVKAFGLLAPLLVASNTPWLLDNSLNMTNKLNSLLELVNQSNKVCIFTTSVEASRYITSMLQASGINTVRLYANDPAATPKTLSMDARAECVDSFMYDPNIKAGVFSILLASESIDLTVADTLIYYDLPWSSIKFLQSLARAVRPGNRHSTVNVYYLVNKRMIDYHQLNLLKEKELSAKAIMDSELSAVTSNINAVDLVDRVLSELLG